MVNPDEGTVLAVAQKLGEKRQAAQNQPEEQSPEQSDRTASANAGPEDDEEQAGDRDYPDNPDEGGEPAEDEPQGEEEEQEPEDFVIPEEYLGQYRVTLKVDGEEQEVTLDELRKRGMLEADYRRKTSEISEERKKLEALREELKGIQSERQQYLEKLELVQKALGTQPYTDEDLTKIRSEKGVEAYVDAKEANEQHNKKLEAIRAEAGKTRNELTEEQKKQYAEYLAKEKTALFNAVPELESEEKQAELFGYLRDMGFEQDQIAQTADHRMFVIAEKARKFDKLQSKSRPKPSAPVPKIHKGKNAKPDKAQTQQKEMDALNKKIRSASGRQREQLVAQRMALKRKQSRR